MVSDTATLSVVAPSAVTLSLQVAVADDGLELLCRGVAGRRYALQCSTNLFGSSHWQAVVTNTMPEGGRLAWTHPAPSQGPIYFRAVLAEE